MYIYFFISSAATILLAVLVSVLLFYLIRAARNLYLISEDVRSGLKNSGELISNLKERLENNFIFRLLFPLLRKKKRSAVKDEDIKKIINSI